MAASWADLVDEWALRNPSPTIANLFNGAYGNGTYLILSNGSGMHLTTDFNSWTSVYNDFLVENVIFANSMFLASGSMGEIFHSADGTSWTEHASGTASILSGLAYGDDRYVVGGSDGITSASINGMDWTPGSTGDGSWIASIAYGEGLFVAVTFDGTIFFSSNGVNWSPATFDVALPALPEFYVVAYGAGRFIVGGAAYYGPAQDNFGFLMLSSEDGQAFTPVTDPNLPNPNAPQEWIDGLKWDGTQFVGAGDGGLVIVSSDGLTWSTRSSGTTSDLFAVVVGETETAAVGRRATSVTSSDLMTWTESDTNPLDGIGFLNLDTIVHDGNRTIVAGFGGAVRTSTDGLTWTNVLHPGGGNFTRSVQGGGRWLLASSVNNDDVPLITSPDGTTWATANVPAGIETCNGVAYGNETYVASVGFDGSHLLLVSDDGVTWTGVDPDGLTTCRGMAFGGGLFVTWTSSVSDAPIKVATSSDGINWVVHDTPITSRALADAAYGDGRWVFIGSSGTVLTTTNFEDWETLDLAYDLEKVFGSPPTAELLLAVAYGNNHWVIAGRKHQFWSSTDGRNWQQAFTTGITFNNARCDDLAFIGDRFWGVGDSGAFFVSEPITGGTIRGPVTLAIHRGEPGSVVLEVTGQAGDDWDLMFSADSPFGPGELKANLTLGVSPTEFPDMIVVGGRGYYWIEDPDAPLRAVRPPLGTDEVVPR